MSFCEEGVCLLFVWHVNRRYITLLCFTRQREGCSVKI